MLVENEYFILLEENGKVIMKTQKEGFPVKSFDALTASFPRLKLHSFKELMTALQTVGEHEIGYFAAPCELNIAPDKMKAELYFHATADEFYADKEQYIAEAKTLLDEAEILYDEKQLESIVFVQNTPVVIASGRQPVKGENAVITYIELPDRTPLLREDGSADHYELNFVTSVAENDWLGEKLPAKEGADGCNVFGEMIPAKKGDDQKLIYDRKSVAEFEEDGKIVLRALLNGVLEELNGAISVGKQLVIAGDVGTKTGSITFEGSVRVLGTVQSGFSVHAAGDISIEGSEGVTNAKEIVSEEGDVYIKGGVFGGAETIVEAKHNVFLKHANSCKIYGEVIHIGSYSLSSELHAQYIKLDRHKGKIIGGTAEALYAIECAYAGNPQERRTKLIVKGVNQEAELENIQKFAEKLKEEHAELKKFQEAIKKMEEAKSGISEEQLEKMRTTIQVKQQQIIGLDQTIKNKLQIIQNTSSPKIEVKQEAYPGVSIQIGKASKMFTRSSKGVFELIGKDMLNV